MRLSRIALVVLLSFASCVHAFAWDDFGHEIIAAIAWTKLTRNAKVKIAEILNTGDQVTIRNQNTGEFHTIDFSIPKWSPHITDIVLETTVRDKFIRCAAWADDIKFGKSKNFDDLINSYSAGTHGVESVPNGERSRLRFWHYINLPITGSDGKKHGYPAANAVDAIAMARLALNPISYHKEIWEQKPMFLFLLIHIVGDLHQPLHCCTNYQFGKKGDAGGNRFQLANGNLHYLWDNGIDLAAAHEGEQFDPSASHVANRWLKDSQYLPSISQRKILDPMKWADEGRTLAIRDAYNIQQGATPSNAYLAKMANDSKRQALLAGYRLAGVLNDIFK